MSQAGKLFDGTILPDIETLTGNAGGAVGPTGGNINVVGDGTTISITGNPGTSTLTASFIGTTDIDITGDTGGVQTGNSFTFNGGTTGLSFNGAADVFTTTFAGITANGGAVALGTDNAGNAITIGTGTVARNINIGLSAAAHVISIGTNNGASSLGLNAGTGDMTLISGDAITLDASGLVELNSTGAAINIGNDANNFAVNVGTAGTRTVTLGSTTATSSTVIKSGSGNVVINSGLTVDSTGRMTNGAQPAFGAYNTVDVANVTGDGTYYTCVFNTELFDYGSNFASNTFTAPKTGIYQFSTTVGVITLGAANTIGVSRINTSDNVFISTYANYSTTIGAAATNGVMMLCGSWMVRMDAADTATLQIAVFNGAKTVSYYGGAVNSYFSGALIC